MSNLIIKRFKGFPPCRLFVYNNLMRGRCDHDPFVREGARFIGPGSVAGWGLFSIYYGNAVTAQKDILRTLHGELYAVPQRCLMWTDQIACTGVDRVCVHVNYTVPDRVPGETPGYTVVEKAHGARGIETAWMHFYARKLPTIHRPLTSLDDLNETEGAE